MRVLVAGAGISGLAVARGLIADGHEVVVLEGADGLRLGGGAITLWCNGTAILGDLGVDLAGTGQRLSTLSLRTARGRRITEVDLESLTARFGSAPRVIPRGSLIKLLAAGLPDGSVRFGARVRDLETDRDGVRVRTATGAEYEADLLVGADGVRSRVRALALGDGPAATTGLAIWQGLTPAPFDPGPTTTLMIGRQADAGFMSAGDGLMQWFFELPWSPADPPAHKPVEMLRRRFAGWGAPVARVLDSLSDGDVERFPHTRHRVPRRWGAGRCVLLGDAAHAMPPVGAHGTNQALEDVAALTACLRAAPAPDAVVDTVVDTVVDAYSARRRRRAARASAVAANTLAASGPRALMQSEPVMRLMAAVPPRLAAPGFAGLLRALSDRI
ncbi:FAD-dependent oxidoreductase [Nonomuraea sp. NPDC001699]